jgi:hypothetical protein
VPRACVSRSLERLTRAGLPIEGKRDFQAPANPEAASPGARQRETREARALAFLRQRSPASALEIGAAAVRGEAWAGSSKVWKAKEQIGLSIALAFARNGLVRPTRTNKFEIVLPAA